jgi:hypothetical protein
MAFDSPWLPKSLTELDLTGYQQFDPFFGGNEVCMAKMLPNLRHLSLALTLRSNHAEWLLSLPGSLVHLGVNRVEEWCQLPASLTAFEIFSDPYYTGLVDFPPHLEQLTLFANSLHEIANFLVVAPMSLQMLTLSGHLRYLGAGAAAPLLPRNLTHLSISSLPFDATTDFFPSRLTSLKLLTLTVEHIQCLPRTLTNLNLWKAVLLKPDLEIPQVLSSLPPRLNRFSCATWLPRGAYSTPITETLSLPPEIKELRLMEAVFCPLSLSSLPMSIILLAINDIAEVPEKVPSHDWPPLLDKIWLQQPSRWFWLK